MGRLERLLEPNFAAFSLPDHPQNAVEQWFAMHRRSEQNQELFRSSASKGGL
jgi:hypothetical protein